MSGNNITCGQSPVLCPAAGSDFLAAGRRWPLLRPDCQAVTRSLGRTTQSAVRQPYRDSDQPAARPAPRHDRRRDRIHLSRGHEKIPDIFPYVCIPLKKSFGGERHTRHQRRHRLFSGSDLCLVAPPLLLHRIIRFPRFGSNSAGSTAIAAPTPAAFDTSHRRIYGMYAHLDFQ